MTGEATPVATLPRAILFPYGRLARLLAAAMPSGADLSLVPFGVAFAAVYGILFGRGRAPSPPSFRPMSPLPRCRRRRRYGPSPSGPWPARRRRMAWSRWSSSRSGCRSPSPCARHVACRQRHRVVLHGGILRVRRRSCRASRVSGDGCFTPAGTAPFFSARFYTRLLVGCRTHGVDACATRPLWLGSRSGAGRT